MRLDVADLGRADAGSGQRGPDDPLLGAPVRRGQSRRLAVLVDGRRDDAGQDMVAALDSRRTGRRSTTATQPSPRTYPSALASNARHRPDRDISPTFEKAM